VFDVAVVLLQMMRPQKQTFRPENLAVPRHSYIHLENVGDRMVADSLL
jgi:hypothetical protein